MEIRLGPAFAPARHEKPSPGPQERQAGFAQKTGRGGSGFQSQDRRINFVSMTRIKRGVQKRARRKKIIKLAKGYISHRKTNFRAAQEALMHAGMHAIRGRKEKKRNFRRLWNIRIGAAAKELGTSYSQLLGQLKKNNIALNRKMLAELAVRSPEVFQKVVEAVKS